MYYDKDGRNITLDQYCDLLESDPKYIFVKQEQVGEFFVSTVWLGVNHNFIDDSLPLIFETIIFKGEERSTTEIWRYATIEEAIENHDAAVSDLKNGTHERVSYWDGYQIGIPNTNEVQ